MPTHPHLSIVIPAYKEEKRIGRTLAVLAEYIPRLPYQVEVIIVDDGSPDGTLNLVQTYQQRLRMLYLRTIQLRFNRGKGYAVKTGMRRARGKYVLFMDADNSTDIRRHLDVFMEAAYKGADVVIASIEVPGATAAQDNGAYRSILSKFSHRLINWFVVPGISDTQRGFKLFTQSAAATIVPYQTLDRFGFDFEMLAIALRRQLRVRELPVVWNNPDGSTVTPRDYARTFVELAKVAINKYRGVYGGTPEAEHIIPFDAYDEHRRGKGFFYKGKEFVHHTNLHHSETALYTFQHAQKMRIGLVVLVFLLFFLLNWQLALLFLFSTLTVLYFLDLLFNAFLIINGFVSRPEIVVTKEELEKLDERTLPLYTIFCPLYREWQVVPQFVEAMKQIDYPTDRLQILMLLEENDAETIQYVREARLPSHFEVVVVPHSQPKTKPKAMNYGMQYVRGEYLAIYDAEDKPEPDQLKKALLAFSQLPPETACVQAKLNFYNPRQNLLTRLFTTEYSLWFDLILPGLQSVQAPIPLGGTSNHFKVAMLRKVSGWDAFNVTEDCDLGVRLAKNGYRTAIIESTTYEEANSNPRNWYNQRSRWVKGYIQTYFVHNRNWRGFVDASGWRKYIYFQATVGGKILSMFINPLMWATTLIYFLFRAQAGGFIQSLFPCPVLYMGVFSIVFGNFAYLYYYMVGCIKRRQYDLVKYAYLVPFYWFGMSIAAWRALYEIAIKPHYWAKTVHGLHLDASQQDTAAAVSFVT